MPTQKKQDAVASIQDKFQGAKGIYFADYLGLNVADMTELRRKCREEEVELTVVKNTLARRSADNAGLKGVEDIFEGPTAIAFSYVDPVSPARILRRFKDSHDLPRIKAFIIEGEVMDTASFGKISQLPAREQLFVQLVTGLSSPLTGLAVMLKSQIVVLIQTLGKLKKAGPS
ncbi:MAG: 50S ribosomal protein L10 [Candidatus Neomarinimicrobiota bacterium]